MLFNSLEFAFFALIAFLGHAVLKDRASKYWLVLVSYVFYGWAEPWYCFLLFGCTVLGYFVSKAIYFTHDPVRRRSFLLIGLTGNLVILILFKYTGFIIRTVNDLLRITIGASAPAIPTWEVPLPLGISFYTFQTISYTIDVYRGNFVPTRNFMNFALFTAFFPKLLTGPIERASHLLRQLERDSGRTAEDVVSGITRILWGLVKKVVFADLLALYVNTKYGNHMDASGLELTLATYAFAFQIYLDFSAYTDIAIGLARIFGIEITENFRWPYLSRNISEFWKRWHMSLSFWLRDYLYFSLGGSRRGGARTVMNVIIVMFLAGLWHGANWTFVVWGLWIGVALAGYHTYAKISGVKTSEDRPIRFVQLPSILLTFHMVLISWIFFRSSSVAAALQISEKILRLDGGSNLLTLVGTVNDFTITAGVLTVVLLMHIFRGMGLLNRFVHIRSPFLTGLFWAGMITMICVFHAPEGSKFIYFQF